MTYDVEALAYHVSYSSDVGSGADSGAMHSEWSGDVEATPLQGRIVFSSVSGKNVFGEGDYALFDRAGAIIVRPQTRTVVDVAPSVRAALSRAQYQIAVKDLEWTVETLTEDEVVAGYHTVHCRATATHRLEIATSAASFLNPNGALQPISTTVADYWYAKVDGLPANPVTPFMSPGLNKSAGAAELVSMWASIAAELEPLGEAIQFHTVIRVKTGEIENVSRFGGVVSDIRRIRIDPLVLTAPGDFFAPESDAIARDRWSNPP